MMPAGRLARISAIGASCATISEYTWHSRTRRAMSCAYCAPRSTTRTGRGRSGVTPSVPHAHALRALVALALGLDRRGDHELGLLELLHVGVARRGHRRREGPEQVERAVVLVGGTDEDLAQRCDLISLHTGPTRKRGMKGGHPPVVAAAGRLVRAREGRADHDGVRAARDGLGDVAAG